MLSKDKKLKLRDTYLNQLIAFQDTEAVKVITGIRRCGKSSMLALMQQHLLTSGISEDQIIAINFESLAFQEMSYKDLYNYVKQRILNGSVSDKNISAKSSVPANNSSFAGGNVSTQAHKKYYLFFDELQRIKQWENAINSFRVDFDCDIYITGSNAYLLSSEYATYLSGRYVEIKMYPLSFKEFLDFHDYQIEEYKTPLGQTKHRAINTRTINSEATSKADELVELRDLFVAYMRYGGMPQLADVGFEQDKVMTLLDGIYSTVIVRDILDREKRRGQRQITDVELLRKIVLFLADNIGNNTSLNSISKTLIAENLLEAAAHHPKVTSSAIPSEAASTTFRPATQTIASYVGALKESYLFYDVKRFDIKGKEYLRTLGKYYIADIGLRNYLLGYRGTDTGHALENVVYFELLRRGYDVAVGKIGALEVDFVATKTDEKIYVQVTESMTDESVRQRELKPLQKVPDNYKKMVLTLNTSLDNEYGGIQVVNVIEWLVELCP